MSAATVGFLLGIPCAAVTLYVLQLLWDPRRASRPSATTYLYVSERLRSLHDKMQAGDISEQEVRRQRAAALEDLSSTDRPN